MRDRRIHPQQAVLLHLLRRVKRSARRPLMSNRQGTSIVRETLN